VTALGVQRTRSSAWQSSVVALSTTGFSISTDDPSLSVVTAPMPTLDLIFGGTAHGAFVSTRRTSSRRPAEVATRTSDRATDPVEMAATADSDAAMQPDEETPQPDEETTQLAEETSQSTEETSQPDEPPEPEPEPHPHRIELIIDSLPNLRLTEPIPVAIDPLGETVFTASVHRLAITATGHSIGEALLILKEQIEAVYNDLAKRSQLDSDQKTMLQMLHTYIAPPSKKPDWMY
jgi:HAMP domain-containing protein